MPGVFPPAGVFTLPGLTLFRGLTLFSEVYCGPVRIKFLSSESFYSYSGRSFMDLFFLFSFLLRSSTSNSFLLVPRPRRIPSLVINSSFDRFFSCLGAGA